MKVNIVDFIRDVKDFPKEGIIFKDITPLLGNAEAMKQATQDILAMLPANIDKVVGIEARGFFFASLLAEHLDAGFVPVRKPGKLPYKTFEESYALEYGTDNLTMHIDAIKPGERVLVHDDVLATGGTAAAAARLIDKVGAHCVECCFILELGFLKGKEGIDAPVYSVIEL
jgi:adenine phosphoribosyltransferase